MIDTKIKYLTIQDYMDKFEVSRQTVYNRIKSGDLKIKKWLNRTLILVE